MAMETNPSTTRKPKFLLTLIGVMKSRAGAMTVSAFSPVVPLMLPGGDASRGHKDVLQLHRRAGLRGKQDWLEGREVSLFLGHESRSLYVAASYRT